MSTDIYIFQIFLSPKKSRDGTSKFQNFKIKKQSLYHLGNLNSTLPLQNRLGPGLESDIPVFVVLFGCW